MPQAKRGEVWIVDLGLAGKVRPCLVLSIPAGPNDRALTTIIPHTTNTRGSRFEISAHVRFLKPGAFDVQNIVSIPHSKLVRRLGALSQQQLRLVETGVREWLGLTDAGDPNQQAP